MLRSNWRYRPRGGTALAWGVTARRLFGDFDLFNGPDRTRVDTREEELDIRVSLAGRKAGAFASVEQSVGPRLTATLGGRGRVGAGGGWWARTAARSAAPAPASDYWRSAGSRRGPGPSKRYPFPGRARVAGEAPTADDA